MKKLLLPALLILATPLAFANPTPEAKALIKAQMAEASHIAPVTLKSDLKAGKDIVLIDVRQKSERPIMGAITASDIHIPRGYIEIKAYSKVADKNANIVVYCGKGIRSAFVTNTLTKMGYKNVRNLKGGIKAWKETGMPTLKVSAQ